MFNSAILGTASITGSIVGIFLMKYQVPKLGFAFCAIIALIITVIGWFTDERLETNNYAQVKDDVLKKYLEEHDGENPTFCHLICIKLQALCLGLQEPLIVKFFTMLIITGILLPQFNMYDFYFAVDVLDISMAVVSF